MQMPTDHSPDEAATPSTAMPGVQTCVHDMLAQWHSEGAQRADPVRFALIEAMARRAVAHTGAARQLLDARLAALVADYQALLLARGIPPVVGAGTRGTQRGAVTPGQAVARGPLGVLVDTLTGSHATPPPASAEKAPASAGTRRTPPAGVASGARSAVKTGTKPAPHVLPTVDLATATLHSTTAPAATQELQSVRRFRGTWSRLSAEERLRQTLAQVPPQAGPLNALHLLHRALVQMRDIAPDYLQHFVEHVDALLWLEQVQAAAVPAPAARSAAVRRKPPAPRSR